MAHKVDNRTPAEMEEKCMSGLVMHVSQLMRLQQWTNSPLELAEIVRRMGESVAVKVEVLVPIPAGSAPPTVTLMLVDSFGGETQVVHSTLAPRDSSPPVATH